MLCLLFQTSHLISSICNQCTVYPTCHGQASDLWLQSSWRGCSCVCLLHVVWFIKGGQGQGLPFPGLPILCLLRSWCGVWVLVVVWCWVRHVSSTRVGVVVGGWGGWSAQPQWLTYKQGWRYRYWLLLGMSHPLVGGRGRMLLRCHGRCHITLQGGGPPHYPALLQLLAPLYFSEQPLGAQSHHGWLHGEAWPRRCMDVVGFKRTADHLITVVQYPYFAPKR